MPNDSPASNAEESAGTGAIDPRLIGVPDHQSDEAEKQIGETVQFVSFRVEDGEYGIDIMAVREIKGWTDVTALPNTPEYVRGVLNLRGVIVPIFDLRNRFGQGLTDATPLHVVIIVAVADRIMGILVDAVSDILTVNTTEILPVPEIESRSEDRFLDGLITVDGRMVSTLALERIFDIEKLIEQVTSAGE